MPAMEHDNVARADHLTAEIRAAFDKLYRRKWWQRRTFSPAEGRRIRALLDELDAINDGRAS